ncbi:MAG: hypothetical protein U0325_28315 [Polyangiales bacterium]
MRRGGALVLALVLWGGAAQAVSPAELLTRATRAEASGDLPAAIAAMEELSAAGVDGSAVLYDLGTLYARAERYGEAVWCFERVLRREPWSLRAQKNLRATRIRLARRDAGRTGTAVVETQPPTRTVIGELLPLDLAVPLAVLAQLAALALWFARRRSKGELARVGLAAATALTLTVALGVMGVIVARRSIPPGAVVLRDGLRLKRAAGRRDPRGALREGERVDVLTRDGEFVRVRTIAGRAGWLAGRELGALTE